MTIAPPPRQRLSYCRQSDRLGGGISANIQHGAREGEERPHPGRELQTAGKKCQKPPGPMITWCLAEEDDRWSSARLNSNRPWCRDLTLITAANSQGRRTLPRQRHKHASTCTSTGVILPDQPGPLNRADNSLTLPRAEQRGSSELIPKKRWTRAGRQNKEKALTDNLPLAAASRALSSQGSPPPLDLSRPPPPPHRRTALYCLLEKSSSPAPLFSLCNYFSKTYLALREHCRAMA
ncbi:unnamed protein product [Nezara viridula]|uniref:Uncharacterized protein n=1 Tax=Nezara viridula TaxID=85310 RepID=A0A9P0HUZ8_NEZVI|nr:unnamed protein product [Nezara viridula]